jgi:phosphohistidine phosphatase
MKTLVLIRHGKSSWQGDVLNDFDRPLNERGKKEAVEMAKRLLRNNIAVDQFVSSPARRAKKTAKLFIREYGNKESEILYLPELYHASIETFGTVVSGLSNDYTTVAVFSHNPGITEFVNTFALAQIDNMPTCGVYAVRAAAASWSEFSMATKELLLFNYPKMEQSN